MNPAVTSLVRGDPAAVLQRHAIRRADDVPTVSLLVGPVWAGGGMWGRFRARTETSAADVIPQSEVIRARILHAHTITPFGADH
jgi:hypothetical protein